MLLLGFTSFLAGVLTILAPCVLPLLPIIIGGSVDGRSKYRPYVITASLAVSVVVFTLLLRASTLLITIPPKFWTYLSGIIVLFFGVITLFPDLWDAVSAKLGFGKTAKTQMAESAKEQNLKGAMFLGLSLGPVFTSCSPTYALILATVLPASFAAGVVYVMLYALGLSLVMLLVALLGRRLTSRLQGAANPKSTFKKVLGVLFILVGLAIITGTDKAIEAWIIDQGYFGVTAIEEQLVDQIRDTGQ